MVPEPEEVVREVVAVALADQEAPVAPAHLSVPEDLVVGPVLVVSAVLAPP